MPRFSERLGLVSVSDALQVEGMSETLRNSLWNYVVSLFEHEGGWYEGARVVANYFRRSPVDELPDYDLPCRDWVKEYFYSLPWYEVYDFVEFIAEKYELIFPSRRVRRPEDLERVFNIILETERSGFRFVAGNLAPISSHVEVAEIAAALESTSESSLAGAHQHLRAALDLFSRRPEPDYRNSIKESISAVESMAKQLGASDSQGLAGALADLNAKVPIHAALRSAFVKLYGYTSDESGIRHAILDEPNVGFDEAKYMLVACSAFVNFVASKAGGVLAAARTDG
ncbi:AbiJ-NTD4 domain-containing protein [Piscinibacter defluvii]|uniref:AbiJ-NTD4 domain-containing protein n=1 Tax=Piscinibacter defluvii TaxID=1796922 RepID=UPI0013E3BC24|nr:hypothetical protein [Piscinibacter defluvii]